MHAAVVLEALLNTNVPWVPLHIREELAGCFEDLDCYQVQSSV